MKKLRERLKSEGKDPNAEFAEAGMTEDDVARGSRAAARRSSATCSERFAPIAFADEEQARAEYDERYVPEQKAAGLPVEPFETVAEEMRRRASRAGVREEVAKWLKELRQKARIGIYRIPPALDTAGPPVVLSTAPDVARTPAP